MSHFSLHFQLEKDGDLLWIICFFLSLCIVGTSAFIFTLIIQHLYCIPKSSLRASFNPEIELKHDKAYSTLSAIFAMLSIIITMSEYPLCSEWSCWNTVLGWTCSILALDTYILSKFFLYLLFIGRLFNPYYRRIYQHSKCNQYLLWSMLLVSVTVLIEFNVDYALLITGVALPQWIDITALIAYSITDCIISIAAITLKHEFFVSQIIQNFRIEGKVHEY